MKTIKILFNFMRKVKHMCSNLKYGCTSCPFYTGSTTNSCKVKNLVYDLTNKGWPSDWDVDEAERKWGD